MTTDVEVHDHIDAAIQFATAGPDSGGHRYQRGKQLVTHLREGAQAAGHAGHADVSNRLTDFAEYAAGEIPLSLLETWYVPGTRESSNRYMRASLEAGLRRSVEVLTEYLRHKPEASAQEARRWLHQVVMAMERWTIGEDRLGGVKMPRYSSDHLTWFSRIQLVLEEPSDQPAVPPDAVEEIADMPGSELIARAVQGRRRRAALDRLRTIVEDRSSSEKDIHGELKRQTWIFGGRYVKDLARRRLTALDEIDIPLLRGDGSLHIVELKRAAVPNLVVSLRSHCAVGSDVHRAVSQAANYLRSLDENREAILADHGIECRRSSATVLIGHPKFLDHPHNAAEVSATLRTYNAVLSRIEVITYQDLIESAERTLALDEDEL